MPAPLPELLTDPAQRAPLAERIAAAATLGAADPRLGSEVAIPAGEFWMGSDPGDESTLSLVTTRFTGSAASRSTALPTRSP